MSVEFDIKPFILWYGHFNSKDLDVDIRQCFLMFFNLLDMYILTYSL